jgi:sugar porter (SP) family MFS transporter
VGAAKSVKSTKQGAVVATFTIGALFGALACTWVGDVLGRRRIVFGAAILTLIGEIMQCTSFHLAQFVVGRFILGWGVGALSATVPVWQSECSSSANRGKHVVLDGCFISLGYLLEAWINLGFFEITSNLALQWRIPLAIPCLISLVPIAAVFSIPESPRWLVNKGRVEEARASLSAFRGVELDNPDVAAEISGIELALEQTQGVVKLSEIFTMGKDKLLYRFTLCVFLQFLQQMCGSNLISTYSTVSSFLRQHLTPFLHCQIIFQQGLGMDAETSRALSGGALTWKFASCFVAFFTIDRFGRRAVFMFSGTGMALCMLALAVASSYPKTNQPAQIASAFFVFLFNFFIPIGFLGANFLYCTEVAPTKLRVAMSGISVAVHWGFNFVVNMATPIAIQSIGWKVSRYLILNPLSHSNSYPSTTWSSLLSRLSYHQLSLYSTQRQWAAAWRSSR